MDTPSRAPGLSGTFKPDHGWAWITLLVGFVSAMIFDGIIFSFGIFLSELANHFEVGLGEAAWIGATISSVYSIVGPVASILANKFGCRVVTICGSILSSLGFILASWATAVWVMVLTYGVMSGIGFGLMYHCAYVTVGHYFTKRRALATGILACGSGVGTFLFAQLGDLMLQEYGWRGSMWLLAGITLNGAVAGACYRPIPGLNTIQKEGKPFRELLDLKLFKSPAFMVLCVSSFICLIGFMIPFVYLPDFSKHMGYSHQKASFLVSIIGITNTLGRIICGWISDKTWADPLKIYNAALIIGGASTMTCAWLSLYSLQATYSAVFGFSVACYVSLCAILIVEFLGLQKLSSAFGFINLSRGIATIIGAPIAGNLYDYTGRFDLTFYVAGSALAMGGIICLPLRQLSRCAAQTVKAENKKHIPTKKVSGAMKDLEIIVKLDNCNIIESNDTLTVQPESEDIL